MISISENGDVEIWYSKERNIKLSEKEYEELKGLIINPPPLTIITDPAKPC